VFAASQYYAALMAEGQLFTVRNASVDG
jgi:hypothetical protein